MNSLHALMHRLHNPDLGILFIRLALGVVFINAGWMKISDMEMVVGFFGQLGFSAGLAYFVSYAELIGGIAFILGIFTRYAGVFLAIIMLVAIKVLFPSGFSLANNGYEYPFVLMLASMALVTFGSGAYSLAGLLKRQK